VTVALALVGLVMVFSASAVVAGNRFQDSVYFLKRHLVWLVVGFPLFTLVSRMDYMVWKRLAFPALGLTVVLLVWVLLPSVEMIKGARRWLRLGPISVQPAEMAKLASILYLAVYLAKREGHLDDFATGFLPPTIVVGLLAVLVLLQPDLGTVVVIGLVTAALLFVAGARLTHLLGLTVVAVASLCVLIWRAPYRLKRIMTVFDPWKDPTGAGFQVTQSVLAFGSGGAFGVGLGEGRQKLFFLPEAHTDFVLALVGEELGLVGTLSVMALYALLVFKGFAIARQAREPFGRYLALGIALQIAFQALINAGVATGLFPTKGLTLPLVSYGGSSLVVTLVALGLLLSISRDRGVGRPTGL
jgi:cell division protein FtsW